MTDAVVRHENEQQCSRPLGEVDILWLNGWLGCDGESVAMTGATQPSVEDFVLGAIPGLPKVRLHNPFLAYENGAAPVFDRRDDVRASHPRVAPLHAGLAQQRARVATV